MAVRTLSKSRFKLAVECPTKAFYSLDTCYVNAGDENEFLRALAGIRAAIALACSTLLVGCGTVAHGTKQDVSITSDPPGASFVVSPSGFTGQTPATIALDRNYDYTIRLSLPGYRDRKAYVRRTVPQDLQRNYVYSCMLLPWICLVAPAVDEEEGGLFDLVPSSLNVTLSADDGVPIVTSETRVLFFNANSGGFVTFAVDGNEVCKLGARKFAVRVLAPGRHQVDAFHMDVFKMKGTSEIDTDGPEQFVAIYDTPFSTWAAAVNELPDGFSEDCQLVRVPDGEPAPDGTGGEP